MFFHVASCFFLRASIFLGLLLLSRPANRSKRGMLFPLPVRSMVGERTAPALQGWNVSCEDILCEFQWRLRRLWGTCNLLAKEVNCGSGLGWQPRFKEMYFQYLPAGSEIMEKLS